MQKLMPIEPEYAQNTLLYWTPERLVKTFGKKKLQITPAEGAKLLRYMGILNKDSSMSANNVSKFLQINHMLQAVIPTIIELAKNAPVLRILDCGCGKSYLSLLLAWYLKHKLNIKYELLGIDTNSKVIQYSNLVAQHMGFAEAKFYPEAIQDFNFDVTWKNLFPGSFLDKSKTIRLNVLVSLHACDTASCHAFAKGIQNKADYLAVAPCCQAELAQKWTSFAATQTEHPLGILFNTPNLRREMASTITDAMRVLLVRSKGYQVSVGEFIASEHTAKNRLFSCIRRGNYLLSAMEEYNNLKNNFAGYSILLETLLTPPEKEAEVLPSLPE